MMPYKSKSDLPDSVQNVLPDHAQDSDKEAFNSAREQYKDKDDRRDDASREETAHRVARAAVKQDDEKGDDEKWYKKINAFSALFDRLSLLQAACELHKVVVSCVETQHMSGRQQ